VKNALVKPSYYVEEGASFNLVLFVPKSISRSSSAIQSYQTVCIETCNHRARERERGRGEREREREVGDFVEVMYRQ